MCRRESLRVLVCCEADFPPPPPPSPSPGREGTRNTKNTLTYLGARRMWKQQALISQHRKYGRIFETKANIPCIKNDFLCVKVGVYVISILWATGNWVRRTNERYDTLQTTSSSSSSFIRRRPPFSSSPFPLCLPSPPRKGSEQ